MKFEMILNAYTNAVIDEQVLLFVGNAQEERKMRATADKTIGRSYLRNRQAAAFRARLLSMYSGDFLQFIKNSRNCWRDRAYLVEQENRDLRERLEDLENAWAVDETIQPDGSLRPSLSDTVKRAAELEAENRQLRQQLEEMENTEIAQENFFDAVRTDTEMSQEQKDHWLAMEPTERENDAEGGRNG